MKYSIRDPKTGRFMKQQIRKALPPRDPTTGRFLKKNAATKTESFKNVEPTPAWKLEFDKHMAKFHEAMANFTAIMDSIH